jgi:hypothetical protein
MGAARVRAILRLGGKQLPTQQQEPDPGTESERGSQGVST